MVENYRWLPSPFGGRVLKCQGRWKAVRVLRVSVPLRSLWFEIGVMGVGMGTAGTSFRPLAGFVV